MKKKRAHITGEFVTDTTGISPIHPLTFFSKTKFIARDKFQKATATFRAFHFLWFTFGIMIFNRGDKNKGDKNA